MKNNKVIVVSYNNGHSSEIVGVCKDDDSAKKLIHKLRCTVPKYFGSPLSFHTSCWDIGENIHESERLSGDKVIIINIGDTYTCYNPTNIDLDYKKFINSGNKIESLKVVVNADDIAFPVIGYFGDQIEYYENEVKPEYQDLIISEDDGFIICVDYNYDESKMFEKAKVLKKNFTKALNFFQAKS